MSDPSVPLIERIRVTVVPPGLRVYPPPGAPRLAYRDEECGLVDASGHLSFYWLCITVSGDQYRLCIFSSTNRTGIAHESLHDSPQDAWDAGVALLLLGVHHG